MQLSARNIIPGKVVDITTGPVAARVRVDIGGGRTVTSLILADSATELGLAVGDAVSVVVKATDVMIAK